MGGMEPVRMAVPFRGRDVELVELPLRQVRRMVAMIEALADPGEKTGPTGEIEAFTDRLVAMARLLCPALTEEEALEATATQLLELLREGWKLNNLGNAVKKSLQEATATVTPPSPAGPPAAPES